MLVHNSIGYIKIFHISAYIIPGQAYLSLNWYIMVYAYIKNIYIAMVLGSELVSNWESHADCMAALTAEP
jgi:hypothetical protein